MKKILEIEKLKEVTDALKQITDNPDGGEVRIIIMGEDGYEDLMTFTMPPLKERSER